MFPAPERELAKLSNAARIVYALTQALFCWLVTEAPCRRVACSRKKKEKKIVCPLVLQQVLRGAEPFHGGKMDSVGIA